MWYIMNLGIQHQEQQAQYYHIWSTLYFLALDSGGEWMASRFEYIEKCNKIIMNALALGTLAHRLFVDSQECVQC